MIIISGAYPLDETLYYAKDARKFHATRTTGVFSSNEDFIVKAGAGRQVILSPGIGWIRLNRFEGLAIWNDLDYPIDLELSDPNFDRIDRIMFQVDLVTNQPKKYAKTGTPALKPVGAVPQFDTEKVEVCFAEIYRPAGSTSISASNIKDTRLDESLCGIMRDAVTRIPTQTLYNQWYAFFNETKEITNSKLQEIEQVIQYLQNRTDTWFTSYVTASANTFNNWYNLFTTGKQSEYTEWFSNITNTLDENQATNLFNMIDTHQKKVINTSEGVHGIRFSDGALQINDGLGWLTLARVTPGLSVAYYKKLNLSVQEYGTKLYTVEQYNNLIEREVV